MAQDDIPAAIIGLGNPGEKYASTRHNVGFWLVDQLARNSSAGFKSESKFLGAACQLSMAGNTLRILKPTTYMNESGSSVRRFMDFFKLEVGQLLVVHDELDLPPGTVRLKRGGGHGGHNGLRDLIQHCGKDFLRLRIGIGHPGDKNQVTNYVLKKPAGDEQRQIEDSIIDGLRAIDVLFADGLEKAMHQLHTQAS
ncbi:MAG: aminoacyl-tRNA hydrolase [Gammaproteobacteria bacterium]